MYITAFFAFKSSIDRFVAGLITEGFELKPGINNPTQKSKIYFTNNEELSVFFCADIDHPILNTSEKTAYKVRQIIRDKEIPCYGFLVHEGIKDFIFNCGYMPKLKQPESTGPYRTNALMENHNV